MQAGFVPAAAFGEARPDGKMNGPAHFLVKEHILAEMLDAVIGANAPLAERTRAGIQVEKRGQEFLVLGRFFPDHAAVLKPQFNITDLAPLGDGGIFKTDPAIDRILDRAGEDLAIRKVIFSIGRLKAAPLDGEGDVQVFPLERDTVMPLEPADQVLLPLAFETPEGHRVVFV